MPQSFAVTKPWALNPTQVDVHPQNMVERHLCDHGLDLWPCPFSRQGPSQENNYPASLPLKLVKTQILSWNPYYLYLYQKNLYLI